MFECQVRFTGSLYRCTKTSWAACLDNQCTLESTLGSVFLRVSIALRPAIWSGARVLIDFDSVGSQGISEGKPSADERADVERYNVCRPPTLPLPSVSMLEISDLTDPECWGVL